VAHLSVSPTGILSTLPFDQAAALWPEIAGDYEPLPLPKDLPGRALTEEEEDSLFRAAAANPNWRVAYLCMTISVNTTAGPGELRMLQLQES
jgi:hypothetical protein